MAARPYRWVIESMLFLLYLVFGISWLAWSPLMSDVQKGMHIPDGLGGMLISAVSVAKAFVPLLAGLLAARLGVRRAIGVGAVLAALAVFAPHAPNFKALVGIRFLFGVGGAIIVTLMGAMVMEWFPRNELPLVNGLNNVAVNCGITIAMFISVKLASQLGWQQALTTLGVACAVVAGAWLLLSRDGVAVEKKKAGDVAPVSFRDVLRMRETWWIAIAFTGPLSLYLALNTWLPSHYMEAFGLTKGAAAQLTGLFNLVGIPSAILGGFLCSRLGLRRPLIITAGLLLPLSAIGMVSATSYGPRLVCAVLVGISFFMYVAPLSTIPMELEGITARHVALMTGVMYSMAYLVSFLSPLIVGWMHTRLGSYEPGLIGAALGASTLVLGGWMLPETGPAARRIESKRPAREVAIAA